MSNFLIKNNHTESDKLSNVSTEIKNDIDEYYRLKKDYEYLLKPKTSTFNYKISQTSDKPLFTSHYPLQFREKDGVLIIEILNDISRKIVFTKKIFIKDVVSVRLYQKQMVEEIADKKRSISNLLLTHKIKSLNEEKQYNKMLLENKLINREDYENGEQLLGDNYASIKEMYEAMSKEIREKKVYYLYVLNSIHKLRIL